MNCIIRVQDHIVLPATVVRNSNGDRILVWPAELAVRLQRKLDAEFAEHLRRWHTRDELHKAFEEV